MGRKVKIYLAGKMSGLTLEEMNTWRKQTELLFKSRSDIIDTINPVDFYNFEMNPDTYTEREIKRFDLKAVKECDLILFNKDFPNSIGTAIELQMAYDVWQKPVIAFGTASNHPWIECCIDKNCNTLLDAVDYIMNFYIPIMY